jgi:hypothetical protein
MVAEQWLKSGRPAMEFHWRAMRTTLVHAGTWGKPLSLLLPASARKKGGWDGEGTGRGEEGEKKRKEQGSERLAQWTHQPCLD